MSEVLYGLKRQPFRASASGADVFVGPQTAKVMQSTKKALAAPDAVVAVIGPAGTGKTTLVKRALGTISGEKQVIHVARMQLGHDQVLELLLDALGATDPPASTLKQFRLFQQLCVEKAEAGIRTIILVEDAVRIGEDALAELEALTAPDGLGNNGANLVLMGDPSLGKLLHSESLVRLRQRLRLYQKVQPLAPAEMQGYLKHCFRMAGGEFDLAFCEEAGTLFHALSAGIPRIVNNLVDSVLSAGAESNLDRIDLETIRRVAEEQYGLTSDMPDVPDKPAAPTAQAGPAARQNTDGSRPLPKPGEGDAPAEAPSATEAPRTAKSPSPAAPLPAAGADVSRPATGKQVRPAATRAAGSAESAEPPEPASGKKPQSAGERDDDALELVQDTLPDLAVLAPQMAGGPDGKKPPADEADDEIPTLFSSQTVDTGAVSPSPGNSAADKQEEEPAKPVDTGEKQPSPPKTETKTPDAGAPGQAAAPPARQPARPGTENRKALKPATEKAGSQPAAAKKSAHEPAAPPPAASDKGAAGKTGAGQTDEREKAAKSAATEKPAPTAGRKTTGQPDAAAKSEGGRPDWDRDPTLAELRPDFDALEQAMAEFADGDVEASSPPPAKPTGDGAHGKDDPPAAEMPEITLDSAIQERIAEETAARDRTDGPRPGDDVPIEAAIEKAEAPVEAPQKPQKPASAQQPSADSTRADKELERIAAGLAKAKSIEDVDDKMAETLFGEEFSAIAAQIAANPPPEYLEAMAESSAPEEAPEKAAAPRSDAAPADDPPRTELEQQFMEVYGEDALNVDIGGENPQAGLDLSASQRLATVRALNGGAGKDPASAKPASGEAAPAGPPPDPIEDQITTSLTQTMRTLQATSYSANDDDDDDGEKKGGFFRRFRRS